MNDNKIPPAKKPFTACGPNQPAARRCILLVDDEPNIRRLIAAGLINAGYHVDTAEDGAAGWTALQAKHYDLLITDNSMPKVTGVELLKKIHAADLAVKVIMATGTFPSHEFTRSPWLEPAAKLVKPYTLEQLLQTVKKVLHG